MIGRPVREPRTAACGSGSRRMRLTTEIVARTRRVPVCYIFRSMSRISPVEPPYPPEIAEVLARWMPPGHAVPPLALFRTIARHPMLRERLRPLGAGLLGHGALPARVRELVILRTSARCGARYEWGVHAAAFAGAVGLDAAAVASTARASVAEVVARAEAGDADAQILRFADELHDRATLTPGGFALATARLGTDGVLELASLAGYYHLIAFVIGVAEVDPEPWAVRFPD